MQKKKIAKNRKFVAQVPSKIHATGRRTGTVPPLLQYRGTVTVPRPVLVENLGPPPQNVMFNFARISICMISKTLLR